MASVSLSAVHKAFSNGAPAVRDVSFEVEDGELVSLVGPSGCGKSTTLNLIAGLEQLTGGVIRIDGAVVNDKPPGARDIAMVFQSYALYPHLDVRHNLAFPLDVAGIDRKTIALRVHETAEILGISELLGRRPRELSGGQRQRVALGRALVRRPKVFLLDEPLSNLDAELRLQMRAELKRLHETLRATFIYVTHDQSEAMTLSDRIVVLDHGVVQQIGAPREIYDTPENAFVAGFFGTPRINFVRPETLGLAPRAEVRAAIRPEHVELFLGNGSANGMAGRVELVEPIGSETWVTVRARDESLVVRTPADLRVEAGAPVRLVPELARVLTFDAATGKRLPT